MLATLSRSSVFWLLVLCALPLACLCANAQSPNLQVMPQPKQLSVTQDAFHFNRETRVVLADPRSEDDRFAAQDFIDDMKATAGATLSIGKGRSRSEILIGRIDLQSVAQALKRMGVESPRWSGLGAPGAASSDTA